MRRSTTSSRSRRAGRPWAGSGPNDVERGESTYLDLNPVLDADVSVVPNGPLSWR